MNLKHLGRLTVISCITLSAMGAASPAMADAPAAPEVPVAPGVLLLKSDSAIATDAAGNSAVVWWNIDRSAGIYRGVVTAQCFAADGSARSALLSTGEFSETVPDVAMDAAGNFIVIWQRLGRLVLNLTEVSGDIVGQRYNAACQPLSTPFVIAKSFLGFTSTPHIAMNATGGFVVSWEAGSIQLPTGIYSSILTTSIHAQRFSPRATAVGLELLVSSQITDFDTFAGRTRITSSADVAINDRGAFVVVWNRGDVNGVPGVFARRYTALGVAAGAQFQVTGVSSVRDTSIPGQTSTFEYPKQIPAVGIDASGNFLVAWDGSTQDGQSGVFARRYGANGAALTPEFRVSEAVQSNSAGAAVAMDPSGQAIITWTLGVESDEPGPPPGYGSIRAQRFDSSGALAGAAFKVDTASGARLRDVSVSNDASGRSFFSWTAVDDSVIRYDPGWGELYKTHAP